MKEKRKFEVDMSDDMVITEENLVHIGEVLAICARNSRTYESRMLSRAADGIVLGSVFLEESI